MFAQLGRFVYRYRWPILVAWAIALAASLPFAPRVGSVLKPGGFSNEESEGAQALALLRRELGASRSTFTVVFSSDSLSAADPAFVAEMEQALAGLRGDPRVQEVLTYRNTGDRRMVSADGHTTFALVGLKLDLDRAQQAIPEMKEHLGENLRHGSDQARLTMLVTGGPAIYHDIDLVSHRDLQRAERYTFPLALAALVLVFGTLVAAAAPVLTGGVSVVITLALIYGLGQITDMSIFVMNIATMLGLGVGIDYALFMVSRFREETARRKTWVSVPNLVEESVVATVATAGRTVLFSGTTVFIGLMGLMTYKYMMLRSLGIGGGLVVILAVLAALTLLPAALGVVGQRIEALSVLPSGNSEEQRFWPRLASLVVRYSWAVIPLVLFFLVTLGSPFFRVRLGAPDATILPADLPSRQGYETMIQTFGIGEVAPILVVLEMAQGDILERENVGALYDFTRELERKEGVLRVDSIVNLDPALTKGQYQLLYARPDAIPYPEAQQALRLMGRGKVTLVRVVTEYPPSAEEAKALVRDIRAMKLGNGMRHYVGGAAAELADIVDDLYDAFPRVLLFVMAITYVALLLAFRSVVLPLKAVVMNLLSILASYGALVFVFQEGHLSGLLRFTPAGYVDATVPIVMFCIIFGLSMDYEVFLLSRVREFYEATGDNTRSVALGLQHSGRLITSAALIIVIVSGSFAFTDIIIIKALGVGIALAILLDATVVRALLVPATMHLLGNWNWWAPGWLRRDASPGGRGL